MSEPPRKASRLLWLLAAAATLGVAGVAWRGGWFGHQPAPEGTPSDPETTFPLPPYSETRFLNTDTETQYVGTDVCAECHRGKHRSYLLTAHSRAFADVDPKAEPPDGSFFHKPSGRSYRVYRQDGRLRHEEVLRTAGGKEIGRIDFPVRYLVGSGRFSRTYLVEVDGFLQESPITWYASKKRWGMSPGYDFPQHQSFARPITLGCLACHAGRVEPADDTVHRLTIHEKAIGCENCHGPGSRHVALHRARKQAEGEEDLTIVNPGKLSRPDLEAICAGCHLSGPATVYLRGRGVTDFRPGRPLTDYRIDYRFDTDQAQMTVVGHIGQLHQSACYQKSDLTCLTCHDLHAREKPKDVTAFYRQKCLGCHTAQECHLEYSQRIQKNTADDCTACHMPRGDTDIPHIAFTHHRIGRHAPRPPSSSGPTPNLVPTGDVSHLAPIDRKRNLGLAYLTVSRQPEFSRYAGVFRERARGLLQGVHERGLRDGLTAEGLAEIYWKEDHARAAAYAREALDAHDLPADLRAATMLLLADCHLQDRNFEPAISLLEDLVRLRRHAEDWRLLGLCYLEQNRPEEALRALQQALSMRPFRPDIHHGLANAYYRLGDIGRSRKHLERSQWLFNHRQE